MTKTIKTDLPEEVVKEAFWLAWQACGGPLGKGRFSNNPNATKEAVWDNVCNCGDYPISHNTTNNELYADYVFGRMMKVGFSWNNNSITFYDSARVEYQSWCRIFSTVEHLVKAAIVVVFGETVVS